MVQQIPTIGETWLTKLKKYHLKHKTVTYSGSSHNYWWLEWILISQQDIKDVPFDVFILVLRFNSTIFDFQLKYRNVILND